MRMSQSPSSAGGKGLGGGWQQPCGGLPGARGCSPLQPKRGTCPFPAPLPFFSLLGSCPLPSARLHQAPSSLCSIIKKPERGAGLIYHLPARDPGPGGSLGSAGSGSGAPLAISRAVGAAGEGIKAACRRKHGCAHRFLLGDGGSCPLPICATLWCPLAWHRGHQRLRTHAISSSLGPFHQSFYQHPWVFISTLGAATWPAPGPNPSASPPHSADIPCLSFPKKTSRPRWAHGAAVPEGRASMTYLVMGPCPGSPLDQWMVMAEP